MTDQRIAKIAAGLSGKMEWTVRKISTGRRSSWPGLSLATLEALERRGLVEASGRGAVGASWSPQTTIKWRLTPTGLAVRNHLQERGDG